MILPHFQILGEVFHQLYEAVKQQKITLYQEEVHQQYKAVPFQITNHNQELILHPHSVAHRHTFPTAQEVAIHRQQDSEHQEEEGVILQQYAYLHPLPIVEVVVNHPEMGFQQE